MRDTLAHIARRLMWQRRKVRMRCAFCAARLLKTAACATVAQMPAPTLFCPFECGSHVLTGANNEAQPEKHHVRFSYLKFSEGKSFLRQSWDPITVYAAIECDNSLYTWRETHVSINEAGNCIEDGTTGMYVLTQKATDDEIAATLDALLI